MYVYKKTESKCWTVGFYDPAGNWHTDSDHNSKEAAAERVSFLNGDNKKIHLLLINIQNRLDDIDRRLAFERLHFA